MKKQWIHAFAAVLLVAGCLAAQGTTKLTATVPFDFQAGLSALPAGEYEVTFVGPKTILLRNWDARASALVLSNSAVGATRNPSAKLIFKKYGEQYFLSSVWPEGYSGMAPVNRDEKRASIASHSAPERVIAARAAR